MVDLPGPAEPTVVRRVFETWSIEVPASFAETFVAADSYWHGYDDHRSVSLTSLHVTDKGRPVSAERISRQLPPLDGLPVDELPPGLIGRAARIATVKSARASQALSGLLATEGRLLIVTITGDDLEWTQRVWRSIRNLSAPFLGQGRRRAHSDGRRVR